MSEELSASEKEQLSDDEFAFPACCQAVRRTDIGAELA
jgi:hypothetical protein